MPQSFDIQALLAGLNSPDVQTRQHVIEKLGQTGAPAAVPGLIERLGDDGQTSQYPARHVCDEAIKALEKIGTPEALAAIAAWQHGEFAPGQPTGIHTLLACLCSPEEQNRERAIEAFGKLGDPAAVPILLRALHNAHWKVCDSIARALGKIGTAAIPNLMEALHDQDSEVRIIAAQALGQIDAPAIPDLLAALRGEDQKMRFYAAWILGEIGDSVATPGLLTALHDQDQWVRAYAAEALGQIGDPAAVPDLLAALNDGDSGMRGNAAEALGRIGDPVAVPQLIACLNDTATHWWRSERVCDVAAHALEQIGTPESLAAIEQWQQQQST